MRDVGETQDFFSRLILIITEDERPVVKFLLESTYTVTEVASINECAGPSNLLYDWTFNL